jgi:predicted transcriptional regulator
MAADNSVSRVDPNLVAQIVRSYVMKNGIAVDQIGEVIAMVHHTLTGLGTNTPTPEAAAERLTPAVPIRRSVQPDYVVCLECGFRGRLLRRHLRTVHGFEPAVYRARWKLPPDHPLTAPAHSAQRSAAAKQLGLGRNPTAGVPPTIGAG